MPSESDPEAFFAELAATALAKAKAAPALVEVTPLIDRGWCLGFRVAGDRGEIVQVNAITKAVGALAYSYRPAKQVSPRRAQQLDRVGLLLCKALELAPLEGPIPPVATHEPGAEHEPPPREHMSFWLPGQCDRRCIFCPVSVETREDQPLRMPMMPSAEVSRERADVESKLRANASRAAEICVEWSGKDCLLSPLFDDGLRLAYELGYRDMSIQTPGSRLLEDGYIEFLRAHSVVRVGLTAHAGDEATFDEVGGKVGAYQAFWTGFERLRAEGFHISLEVPCVAKTVEGLPQHLAKLSSYPCRVTCFFWYREPDMHEAFNEVGVAFAPAIRALEQTRELVPPGRIAIDGIPECVVPTQLRPHFYWSYGDGHMTFIDFVRVPGCEQCAAADRCPGIAPAYLQQHQLQHQPLSS